MINRSIFNLISFPDSSVTSADSLIGSGSTSGSLRRRRTKRQDSYDSNASAASLKRKQEIEGKLIETEKSETGGVDFAVYKHYIQSVGVFLCIATLVLNFVFQAFQIGSNLWLTKWSDDKAVETDTGLRNMYLGVYGAFGVGQGEFIVIQFCCSSCSIVSFMFVVVTLCYRNRNCYCLIFVSFVFQLFYYRFEKCVGNSYKAHRRVKLNFQHI